MKLFKICAAALMVLSVLLGVAGCDFGDKNPVTPDKMEEIRKKQDQERANWKPPTDTQRPATSG